MGSVGEGGGGRRRKRGGGERGGGSGPSSTGVPAITWVAPRCARTVRRGIKSSSDRCFKQLVFLNSLLPGFKELWFGGPLTLFGARSSRVPAAVRLAGSSCVALRLSLLCRHSPWCNLRSKRWRLGRLRGGTPVRRRAGRVAITLEGGQPVFLTPPNLTSNRSSQPTNYLYLYLYLYFHLLN